MTIKKAMGILTCNRTDLLKQTLESFFSFNSMRDMSCILLDNNSDDCYSRDNKILSNDFGFKYVYNVQCKKNKNKGACEDDNREINIKIELGHSRLIQELLKTNADLFFILEDDWNCLGEVPFDDIYSFLSENKGIGQVRIRDYRYDDSFYGGSSKNFVTLKRIEFTETIIINGSIFKIANMHWVNSCIAMRREALEYMSKLFESEIDKMMFFYDRYPQNAQLLPGIFYHTGPNRIRNDLKAKGLFDNENFS